MIIHIYNIIKHIYSMIKHIFTIFKQLAKRKKRDKHLKVAIYTNNMGPRSWTLHIKNYIEHKIKSKLFDKIITGYRPHEKGNCRSTHSKTHKDLIKCVKLPKNTNIVFLTTSTIQK